LGRSTWPVCYWLDCLLLFAPDPNDLISHPQPRPPAPAPDRVPSAELLFPIDPPSKPSSGMVPDPRPPNIQPRNQKKTKLNSCIKSGQSTWSSKCVVCHILRGPKALLVRRAVREGWAARAEGTITRGEVGHEKERRGRREEGCRGEPVESEKTG